MTVDDDSFLVDTSVLLTAVDDRRAAHERALGLIRDTPRGDMVLSPQILREFIGVATRPADVNGLGMSNVAVLANVDTLLGRVRLVEDTVAVTSFLRDLFRDGRFAGNQIHDANLVATAWVHRVPRIVTGNVSDFERFADLIEIEALN